MAIYIAHISGVRIQTIYEHSHAVANLAEQNGNKVGLGKTARLAGLLHDMGKYSDAFQIYLTSKQNELEKVSAEDFSGKVDHGQYGGQYLYEYFHKQNGYRKWSEILSLVIMYHHGGLADCANYEAKSPVLERIYKSPKDFEIVRERFFSEIISEADLAILATESKTEFDAIYNKLKNFPVSADKKNRIWFLMGLVIKYIYSCLIDADRLDTMQFQDNLSIDESTNNANRWEIYALLLESYLRDINSTKANSLRQNEINNLRQQISDKCFTAADKPTGIYTLTVPTGGGKTLASLRFALNHAQKNGEGIDRIIYVLPYTTIIEQNAKVVRNILRCDNDLLEHHSNVNLSDTDPDYRLLTERWNSPIIFTTLVQFLNTFYAGGSQPVRKLHNLSHSIIVFDEVQAVPVNCLSLFTQAINFLAYAAHATILLCTATQPSLEDVKASLLKLNYSEIIPDLNSMFVKFKRMNILDCCRAEKYTIEDLFDYAWPILQNNQSLLIVVNLKKQVTELFQLFKTAAQDTKIFCLTTLLCPVHRKEKLGKMHTAMNAHEKVLCISTNLIECGVDISFDEVIRDLAGLPSIAQSSGRGNRNGESEALKKTHIVNLAENLGSGLKEIAIGQKHTETLLKFYQNNPEYFQYDLLSPIANNAYFHNYYQDQAIQSQMDYPIKIKGSNTSRTLVDNLLDNDSTLLSDMKRNHVDFSIIYQFRLAGEYFHVIPQITFSILAPYGDRGKSLITDLCRENPLSKKADLLKEIQQYCISVYENEYKKLVHDNALLLSPIKDLYILREGYYHGDTGLDHQYQLGDAAIC